MFECFVATLLIAYPYLARNSGRPHVHTTIAEKWCISGHNMITVT